MKLAEFFQDDCGQLSMSRFLVFLVVVTFLILAAIETGLDGAIPDVPAGWYWLAALMYGVNRAAPAIETIFGKKKEEPKP